MYYKDQVENYTHDAQMSDTKNPKTPADKTYFPLWLLTVLILCILGAGAFFLFRMQKSDAGKKSFGF